jgi:hypothetical protein
VPIFLLLLLLLLLFIKTANGLLTRWQLYYSKKQERTLEMNDALAGTVVEPFVRKWEQMAEC